MKASGMKALEIYAVVAPVIALTMMGAFGWFLFRKDVTSFRLHSARTATDRLAAGSATSQAAPRTAPLGAHSADLPAE
jgi:hypothetical protein